MNDGREHLRTDRKQLTCQKPMNRRAWLQSAAALLGTTAASGMVTPAARDTHNKEGAGQPAATDKSPIVASAEVAIADTTTGKVRGYIRNGIYTYKGIPYGDTTGGSGRFQPPQKAKPWRGVRGSMQYGRVCPQGPRGSWNADEEAWLFLYDDGVQGEDCLRVNIWAPALDGHRKRPLLFRQYRPQREPDRRRPWPAGAGSQCQRVVDSVRPQWESQSPWVTQLAGLLGGDLSHYDFRHPMQNEEQS